MKKRILNTEEREQSHESTEERKACEKRPRGEDTWKYERRGRRRRGRRIAGDETTLGQRR